ncbi:hypothetical protein C7M84_003314 [Penaeus vannamei]|uniref:Uncharacterized protein n=1 Tax=Penaeus vannamei TaxID=6689 RepID=A0A3R7PNV3_PENVA|nr:hypothetical protein C7M84_003314 [Penaeus vannamei]
MGGVTGGGSEIFLSPGEGADEGGGVGGGAPPATRADGEVCALLGGPEEKDLGEIRAHSRVLGSRSGHLAVRATTGRPGHPSRAVTVQEHQPRRVLSSSLIPRAPRVHSTLSCRAPSVYPSSGCHAPAACHLSLACHEPRCEDLCYCPSWRRVPGSWCSDAFGEGGVRACAHTRIARFRPVLSLVLLLFLLVLSNPSSFFFLLRVSYPSSFSSCPILHPSRPVLSLVLLVLFLPPSSCPIPSPSRLILSLVLFFLLRPSSFSSCPIPGPSRPALSLVLLVLPYPSSFSSCPIPVCPILHPSPVLSPSSCPIPGPGPFLPPSSCPIPHPSRHVLSLALVLFFLRRTTLSLLVLPYLSSTSSCPIPDPLPPSSYPIPRPRRPVLSLALVLFFLRRPALSLIHLVLSYPWSWSSPLAAVPRRRPPRRPERLRASGVRPELTPAGRFSGSLAAGRGVRIPTLSCLRVRVRVRSAV